MKIPPYFCIMEKKQRNYTRVVKNKRYSFTTLRKGLKRVHIGDDVWLIGRQKYVKGKLHSVIYGPDRKEYHVWDRDLKQICSTISEYGDVMYDNVRDGNGANHSKLKIYILTCILDKRENWCFDLNKIPPNGHLKVICENGTIKNIDFDGTFRRLELVSKRFTVYDNQNPFSYYNTIPHSNMYFVNPVGYRIN